MLSTTLSGDTKLGGVVQLGNKLFRIVSIPFEDIRNCVKTKLQQQRLITQKDSKTTD